MTNSYVPGRIPKNGKHMKNNKLKIAIGLIMLPFAAIIHLLDRYIIASMPWLEQTSIQNWFNDSKTIAHSCIRVATVGIITLIVLLIKMRING